ncbi:uncharacterized protein LOC132174251 [Corylus avellana]|uniref:uncharacterized protein LOC132174251 n=1 Tax=Corylus avellana TaxID=13451 RepID=UPI00286BD89F|nr:uncharacterized protein LOC132174251 [Corylus avellana]
MVNTRSQSVRQPGVPPGAAGAPLELADFMKQMTESMKALQKQNEDLATRLTVAEGQNSRRNQEREERRMKRQEDRRERERRAEIHRGKRPRGFEEEDEEDHRTEGYNESNVNADLQELKKKCDEMARQIVDGGDQTNAGELMENTSLPFTPRVMNFPLPDKFKMPQVNLYNGTGDPTEHMEGLRAHFILHGTPDAISCRVFPLTLAGVAKDWFGKLPANSIDDFKTLGRLFLSQFLATRKRKKNPAYLLSLVQEKEESLKEFMLRFNQEKLMIENPPEQTVLDALMHGVRAEGPLMAELSKSTKLVTLGQFIKKADEYINQEETVKALMKNQKEKLEAKGSKEKVAPASAVKKEEKSVKRSEKVAPSYPRMDPRKLQSAKFSPLNTSMLSKLKGDPKRRDPQKYCEYHCDHGHLTEECITLRQEIENHIRNGRLVKFLAGERNQRRNEEPLLLEGDREAHRNREARPREDRYAEPMQDQQAEPRRDREFHQPRHQDVVREIHTISGGLAGGGISSSSRKAYARRTKADNEVLLVERPLKIARRARMAISFSEEDERGVIFPHDDVLVVTLTVANHKIHRVLVDNGSLANILYWLVFKQMGVERNRIQPFDSPLVGFVGEQV